MARSEATLPAILRQVDLDLYRLGLGWGASTLVPGSTDNAAPRLCLDPRPTAPTAIAPGLAAVLSTLFRHAPLRMGFGFSGIELRVPRQWDISPLLPLWGQLFERCALGSIVIRATDPHGTVRGVIDSPTLACGIRLAMPGNAAVCRTLADTCAVLSRRFDRQVQVGIRLERPAADPATAETLGALLAYLVPTPQLERLYNRVGRDSVTYGGLMAAGFLAESFWAGVFAVVAIIAGEAVATLAHGARFQRRVPQRIDIADARGPIFTLEAPTWHARAYTWHRPSPWGFRHDKIVVSRTPSYRTPCGDLRPMSEALPASPDAVD